MAHPGVEVEQEQVVDDRGIGPTDPVTALVVYRPGPGGQVGDHVWRQHLDPVAHLGGMQVRAAPVGV